MLNSFFPRTIFETHSSALVTSADVYVKNETGQYRLDRNGHLIVDHDLHNHNGEMPDGIAEAFIHWAKKEKLSFWTGRKSKG